MFSKSFMRLLLVGATAVMFAFVIAPAGFAASLGCDSSSTDGSAGSSAVSGECATTTTDQPAPAPSTPAPTQSSGSSGSSDHKVAVGGVQTGAGGMASVSEPNVLLPLSIGGALILLSSVGAGGLAFRRR
jgi:hypothetical protein